jgi:hypothetical protein
MKLWKITSSKEWKHFTCKVPSQSLDTFTSQRNNVTLSKKHLGPTTTMVTHNHSNVNLLLQ